MKSRCTMQWSIAPYQTKIPQLNQNIHPRIVLPYPQGHWSPVYQPVILTLMLYSDCISLSSSLLVTTKALPASCSMIIKDPLLSWRLYMRLVRQDCNEKAGIHKGYTFERLSHGRRQQTTGPKCHYIFKIFKIIELQYHICNHHGKCIWISTNMPGIVSINLKITWNLERFERTWRILHGKTSGYVLSVKFQLFFFSSELVLALTLTY